MKIKIAYIINDLLRGGAQTLLLNMCRKLSKEKFDITIVYLYEYQGKKATFNKEFEAEGIDLVCLSSEKKRGLFSLVKTCKTIFKKIKPDIVHAHLPNAVIVGGLASIVTRTPFIIHEHNTHRFHSYKINLAFRILRPFAKLSIFYAETLERELYGAAHVISKKGDFKGQKKITILNGIDIEYIQNIKKHFTKGGGAWDAKRESVGIRKDQVVLFSSARFVAWKGHRHLAQAFIEAAGKSPELILVIAGDGPEKDVVQQLVDEAGLHDRVILLGSRTDVMEWLSVADIYSLVFEYTKEMKNAEAIGIAGFEAMAAGLPVIIGDYGGAHFYIKNQHNGSIVPPYDVQALVQEILKLVKDPELRQKMGEHALMRVLEILNLYDMIKVYEEIYTDLCTTYRS